MDLKTYLGPMDAEGRARFASLCGTTLGHLQNVIYGVRPCAPKLAAQIEIHSKGAVTRRDLRDDWREIWPPELEKRMGVLPDTGHRTRRTDRLKTEKVV